MQILKHYSLVTRKHAFVVLLISTLALTGRPFCQFAVFMHDISLSRLFNGIPKCITQLYLYAPVSGKEAHH